MSALTFALNHMVAPRFGLNEFLDLAESLSIRKVEVRNDLPGVALQDGTPAEAVRAEAERRGIAIAAINALQRFDQWTPERAREAEALIDQAKASGAQAIVLCPVNDTAYAPGDEQRLAALRQALSGLRPLLAAAGIQGLIEPLGFAECSLRLKREAVDAIKAVGGEDVFRVVHDTFHHHVAGETEIFPQWTGLVHISGVVDPAVPVKAMRDPHRVLVTPDDLIDNVGQVRRLRAGGYAGPISFEPFARSVHGSRDIAAELKDSIGFVGTGLRAAAA